jgi:MarR family 2-MHQ and catechol resistance regulon transcriptional repressor
MSITITEFADKINEIMPVMIKEFSKRHSNEIYKGKITLPQFLILGLLHDNRDIKMCNIAKFMSVTTAAMTGMIDRLEKYEYVKREPEPGDRRVIKVILTRKGAELVKKINEQRRRMIIDVFGRVSKQDRADYLRVLMRIKDILTKNRQWKKQ